MKKEIKYDLAAYSSLPYEIRRAPREALDFVNVERGLTQIFADLGGLEVDREIFRHAIPQHQKEGYGVRLFRVAPGNETDVCKIELTVWGKAEITMNCGGICPAWPCGCR